MESYDHGYNGMNSGYHPGGGEPQYMVGGPQYAGPPQGGYPGGGEGGGIPVNPPQYGMAPQQYGGVGDDNYHNVRRSSGANRTSFNLGEENHHHNSRRSSGRASFNNSTPQYRGPSHNNSGIRNATASIATDLTSTAGYTLSGNFVPPADNRPPRRLDEEHVKQLLEQGFSNGLAKALAENADAFERRIWVVDNSGSMQIGDGHRIVINSINGKVEATPVTRWEEIQDTIIYHSQMAAVLNSPTIFRLLNDPGPSVGRQEFSVCNAGNDVEREIRQAKQIMQRAKPDGVTPLTQHIWEIQAQIREMLPILRQSGQRVAVILATDGLPTDDQGFGGDDITNEFIASLRALEGLPIWLVIRLCTDEDKVTEFYNELDGKLELSLEVLDDFLGESKEVHSFNPWLNYSLPMHRCRELGYHDRLFDLIDERALTKGELREFCVLLFGSESAEIPDPVSDWKDFIGYIQERLTHERQQWNPIKKKNGPWISIKALNRIYNGGKCAIM